MAIHAACCRCGSWFVQSETGAGFWADYVGLCGKCKEEVGDLDKATDALTRRIRSLGEDARGYHRDLSAAVQRSEAAWNSLWGISGSTARFSKAVLDIGLSAQSFRPAPATTSGMAAATGADAFSTMVDDFQDLYPENLAPERRTTLPPDDLPELARSEDRPERVLARAHPRTRTGRYPDRALDTAIRASNAEVDAYYDRIRAGEYPFIKVGAVNEPGSDFVTLELQDNSDVDVWINDATKNVKRPAGITDRQWKAWVEGDLQREIERLPEGSELRKKVQDAVDNDRVYFRQAKIDYSPSGQGRIDWEYPPTGSRGAHPTRSGPRAPRGGAARRGGSGFTAGRALSSALNAVGLVQALIDFAAATEELTTNIGECYVASREADDWRRLIDKIEKDIDDLTKKKQCLLGEQENRKRGTP